MIMMMMMMMMMIIIIIIIETGVQNGSTFLKVI